MAVQTEFPTFGNEKTASCYLFAFYSFFKIKNTYVKIYIFEKIIGRESEVKKINKIEKY
jgi:hypothetical protein